MNFCFCFRVGPATCSHHKHKGGKWHSKNHADMGGKSARAKQGQHTSVPKGYLTWYTDPKPTTTKAYDDNIFVFSLIKINVSGSDGCQQGLSWSFSQHMLHAASVTGVTYSITDTQSSHKCPCKQVQRSTGHNRFTLYVSYAAVSISVVARNAAGFSPAAVASLGQIATADLKSE